MLADRARMAAAAPREDVTIVDDGDAAPSSGAGTATHTYNSQTSTGPKSALLITWREASDFELSTVTWNGNSMNILAQTHFVDANGVGAAIAIISGAQSGNVVLGFSGSVDDSHITKVSLDNLVSIAARDTDTDTDNVNLDNLTSPGDGGIRLAAFADKSSGNTVSWTNATELSDLDAGAHRHSAAYDLGDDGGTITPSGGSTDQAVAGVSLR